MKLKLIGERIMVKRDEAEEKTAGGIIVPDAHKGKSLIGTVAEVGDVKEIKKGDKVLYAKFTGDEVEFNNEKFLIVQYEDVIGTIV